MLKKIIRIGLPLAFALGLFLPLVNTGLAQEKSGGDERARRKKAQKSKGKGEGEKKKTEQRKGQ